MKERIEELGEVAVERFLVAALDHQFIVVAEDERAKAVPLGLEDPFVAIGDVIDSLREHRENGRFDCGVHAPMVYRRLKLFI